MLYSHEKLAFNSSLHFTSPSPIALLLSPSVLSPSPASSASSPAVCIHHCHCHQSSSFPFSKHIHTLRPIDACTISVRHQHVRLPYENNYRPFRPPTSTWRYPPQLPGARMRARPLVTTFNCVLHVLTLSFHRRLFPNLVGFLAFPPFFLFFFSPALRTPITYRAVLCHIHYCAAITTHIPTYISACRLSAHLTHCTPPPVRREGLARFQAPKREQIEINYLLSCPPS